MVKLTPTARVILGMLKLGARTGYDIKRVTEFSTRFFWGASYGQIYPELRKLERRGLIEGEHDPRGGNRPPRVPPDRGRRGRAPRVAYRPRELDLRVPRRAAAPPLLRRPDRPGRGARERPDDAGVVGARRPASSVGSRSTRSRTRRRDTSTRSPRCASGSDSPTGSRTGTASSNGGSRPARRRRLSRTFNPRAEARSVPPAGNRGSGPPLSSAAIRPQSGWWPTTTTVSPRPLTSWSTDWAVAPGASRSSGSTGTAKARPSSAPVSRARRSGLVSTASGRRSSAASCSPSARAASRPPGVSGRSSSGSPGAASA